MEDVISNDKGQIMLLTVFLIIIEVVSFTAILNNMILTSNMPSTGLDESKYQISDLRYVTESEIQKAAYYAESSVPEPENVTQLKNYFYNYINSYNNTIMKLYAAQGASVEIIVNNISINKTIINNISAQKYSLNIQNNTFGNGSLIIPMDGTQKFMKVFGLIYRTLDDTGTPGQLSGTKIPVWEILQNPKNSTVQDFNTTIYTDDNASSTGMGIVKNRSYSGGPFLINSNDIDETRRGLILAEAKNEGIIVHELASPFFYKSAIRLENKPNIAAYPLAQLGPMDDYYIDADVPYTAIDNKDILNGNLTQFDVLTIPHHDMMSEPENVINSIVGWVASGGVLHAECEATDTMDDAVERYSIAGSAKPWYGFVGTSKSRSVPDKYLAFLDNSTLLNASSSFNTSPPLPVAGLSDPGVPYNPIAQSSNPSGIAGDTGGSTSAFSLRERSSEVNPSTNILAYTSDVNGIAIYGDYDSDGIKEPQLMYVEASFENGFVSYIAGHDLSKREGDAERLIFQVFFAASKKDKKITPIYAKNINLTIKYNDGKVKLEETYLIKT